MKNVIVPPNSDWIEVGPYVDDTGAQFVGLHFTDPDHDGTSVSLSRSFFESYVDHLIRVRDALKSDTIWSEAAQLAEKDRRRR
jgi:hypothetical protein